MMLDPLGLMVSWLYAQLYIVIKVLGGWYFDAAMPWAIRLPSPGNPVVGPIQAEITNLVFMSYAVVIVAGGLIVMTHNSVQTQYSANEVAPRLVIGFIMAWATPLILRFLADTNHALVNGLLSVDSPLDHWAVPGTHSEPLDVIEALLLVQRIGDWTILSVLQLACLGAAMALLLISTVIRSILWLALAMIGPLCLACHGLPWTEGVAQWWWRMVTGCMLSSLGQAACIFIWTRLAFDTDGQSITPAPVDMAWDLSLDPIYLLLMLWGTWKVHSISMGWARGKKVRFPGSRLAVGIAGAVAWRVIGSASGPGGVLAIVGGSRRGRTPNNPPSHRTPGATRPAHTPRSRRRAPARPNPPAPIGAAPSPPTHWPAQPPQPGQTAVHWPGQTAAAHNTYTPANTVTPQTPTRPMVPGTVRHAGPRAWRPDLIPNPPPSTPGRKKSGNSRARPSPASTTPPPRSSAPKPKPPNNAGGQP